MPDARDRELSDDPEALLAEIERVHGPAVAAVARRSMAVQPPRRRPVPRKEGHGREVPGASFVRSDSYRQSVSVRDGGQD